MTIKVVRIFPDGMVRVIECLSASPAGLIKAHKIAVRERLKLHPEDRPWVRIRIGLEGYSAGVVDGGWVDPIQEDQLEPKGRRHIKAPGIGSSLTVARAIIKNWKLQNLAARNPPPLGVSFSCPLKRFGGAFQE